MMPDFEEHHEEEPPDHLRRKWEDEDAGVSGEKPCPHCGQPIPSDSFSCLFCGERVFRNSGLLGRILSALQGGAGLWLLAALVLMFAVLWMW